MIEINPGQKLVAFSSDASQICASFVSELDMQGMSFADSSIDVIIHSDTLEHVPDSKAALKECHARFEAGRPFVLYCADCCRPLDPDAARIATELSREPGVNRDDCIVQTEYGADFWCEIFDAGFREVTLTSLIFQLGRHPCNQA